MSLMFDEYGRPVIVVKEAQAKGRLKGIAAQKANISAARNVANVLRTSLGPKGERSARPPLPLLCELCCDHRCAVTPGFPSYLQVWTKCWLALMAT